MKNFIQGMIFITLVVSIINSIVAIIEQWSEYICTRIAAATYKYAKQLPQDQCQCEEEDGNDFQMGFCSTEAIGVPIETEYEIDEEE